MTQRRHLVVEATPAEAYDAVRGVDLMRLGRGPRLLNELRILPERVGAFLGGRDQPAVPDSMRFEDLLGETGYVVLDEEPDEEFVIGAIGKF